jgi:hypothetical protein
MRGISVIGLLLAVFFCLLGTTSRANYGNGVFHKKKLLQTNAGTTRILSPKHNQYYIDHDFIRNHGLSINLGFNFYRGFGTYTYESLGITKNNNFLAMAIHGDVGYQIHRKLILGVGSGIDAYDNFSVMPVYGIIKICFKDTKVTPFVTGSLGTAIGIRNEHYGAFGALGFGLKTYVSHRAALNFNVGYKYQDLFIGNYIVSPYVKYDVSDYIGLNLLTFGMGFSF